MLDLQVAATVTTAAASYDLVQLADVHTELNIPTGDTSKDAWIASAISRVSEAIQTHCNRVFAAETLTETIYPQRDGYGAMVPGCMQPLQLSRWPIIDVTSVTTLQNLSAPIVLTAGTDFIVKGIRSPGDCGQLLRMNAQTGFMSAWDAVPTQVVYEAGYAAIPLDVVDACLRMITKAWWARGRDPSIIEQNQGMMGSTRYWVTNGAEGNMPPDIADLLDGKYRVPVAR